MIFPRFLLGLLSLGCIGLSSVVDIQELTLVLIIIEFEPRHVISNNVTF